MATLTDVKINWQRWLHRLRRARFEKVDAKRQLRFIEKAEKLSKRRKCRLWVVRMSPGNYRIYTKGDVKAVLRKIGLKGRINLFTINGTVVHITKYNANR